MQEFIQSVAQRLGIEESVASQATSMASSFIKDKLSGAEFEQVAANVPGLATQAAQAEIEGAAAGGGGGMLGGMMKAASSALGGDAGDALALTGKLKEAGLNADQLGPFLSQLVEFIRAKAGDDTVAMIIEKLPQLKSLIG